MYKVKKRNGFIAPYDLEKISIAISGAFQDFDKEFEDIEVLNDIEDRLQQFFFNKDEYAPIEDIQDIVEDTLLDHGYREEAKAYIRYRYEHELARQKELEKQVEDKLLAKQIDNQNANIDEHSFGGRMGEANSVVMKNYALNHCMSKMAKENHLNNEIYIHDLDHYAVGDHNCLSIPFDKLLANGFNTRQTDVRPANSINTAFQLVAVIFQLQSLMQFGGVAATHLDWTMVPYVRKSFYKHYIDGLKWLHPAKQVGENCFEKEDISWFWEDGRKPEDISIKDSLYARDEQVQIYAYEKTKQETHQAVEGMYHNLNTLQSRSGNQLPFTSINYGTCTLAEGRMVTKALLEVSIEGLGKLHKTSIFPCGIFQCMKGVNRKPEDPNYDLFRLALKSTAQRLYPNYVNVDWSVNEGYDPDDPCTYTATMGL